MLNIVTEKNLKKARRAYILYEIDTDVSISIITNYGTEVAHRSAGRAAMSFPNNLYVIQLEIPDFNFLKEKNTVVVEIGYNPIPFVEKEYYSPVYTFSLNSENSNFFIIGFNFKKSESLSYKNPPGKSVESQPLELMYFFKFICEKYVKIAKKCIEMQEFDRLEIIMRESSNELNDLIYIFKTINENSLLSSQKMINEYLNNFDDYIISSLSQMNDHPIIFNFMICMIGVFPLDYFTNRDYFLKNCGILLNYTSQTSKDILGVIIQLESVKSYFNNGLCALITMNIKDGGGIWLKLIKTNLISILFDENLFFLRINDLIKRCQCSMKIKESYLEAKSYLLKGVERISEPVNNSLTYNTIFKNIAILSSNKENLIEIIFDFHEQGILEIDKIKILKEEIRRKKWESESRDNYFNWICRFKNLIAVLDQNKIKEELTILMYELSNLPQYIFVLFKSFNYENIESPLINNSFYNIHEVAINDYLFLLSEFRLMPSSLQEQLIHAGFIDKIKLSLKKISVPFDEKTREVLRETLLSKEIFPASSMDYLREYIRCKPSFEDIVFIVNDILLPQKKVNETQFKEIFISLKNYIINMSNDIMIVIRIFSNCIKKIVTKQDDEGLEQLDFMKFITQDFWKSISQLYSPEVFLCLSQYFCDDEKNFDLDPFVEESYIAFAKTITDSLSNDKSVIDKINHFFNTISILNENGEKSIHAKSRSTETIINYILDILSKTADPMKNIKLYLYENPKKDHFWLKLLRATGNFISFTKHEYIKNVKTVINEYFNRLSDDNLMINEYISLAKLNENQKEAVFLFFNSINVTNFDEIKGIINEKLKNLDEKLNNLTLFENFFILYGSKIENSDTHLLSLKEIREGFRNIVFMNFTIKKELLDLKDNVMNINHWSETVIFRNVFETEFSAALKIKQDKEKKEKKNIIPDKNINIKTMEDNKKAIEDISQKIPLQLFVGISQTCINKVTQALEKLLQNKNFSELTLSAAMQYFKGLEIYERECNIIKEKIKLNEYQSILLSNLLKTFYEITSFIKFSDIMIKLNIKFKFTETKIKIYEEFIKLIANKASSFEKIYQASSQLSGFRNSYLEKREIENLLYELAEDKELIDFLLVTPEEDIRNMVDAVDEHGDSFIRVQTIRDLLIVGSFLRAIVLKEFNGVNNLTEKDFINRIHDAFNNKTGISGIDVLMNSCSKQIIGIKHLHHELSNREEASKIKAKEITNLSLFQINFNEKKLAYEIILIYGKSNKRLNFKDLCDLRDRVLLLLYNEKERESNDIENSQKENNQIIENSTHLRETLTSFIKVVEISEKILFVLNDIFINGFPIHFSKSTEFSNGNLNPFHNLLDEISLINSKWNDDLKEAYEKYYPLTYFNGKQFWEIEKIFLNTEIKIEELINLPGYFLLKFADMSFDIRKFTINYSIENFDPKQRIFKLGETLSNVLNVEDNEKNKIDKIVKVNLNLKGTKFLFSSPPTLRMFSYLLSLHFSIESSLPNSNQIFYCYKKTSFHELIAFLLRFVLCPVVKLFTILRVECLSFDLQNFLVEQVNKLIKNKSLKATLSIICCDTYSFIFTQFSENPLVYLIRDFDILDDALIKQNLEYKNLNTFVVRSNDTGAGKSYFIRSKIRKEFEYINFPILDSFDINKINERFYQLNHIQNSKLIHLTIIGIIDDYEMLEYILFKFIILGCLNNDIYVSFRNIEDPIYIEISNTYNDYLHSAISILSLFSNEEFIISDENLKNLEITDQNKEMIQIVANYLHHLNNNSLNDTDIILDSMQEFTKEIIFNLLNQYFIKNNRDITFRQVMIFISVLADQLKKFSSCDYFKVTTIKFIKDSNLKDIRVKVLICLIKMTEEFTTRSIKAARDSQNNAAITFKRSFSRENLQNKENVIDEINSLSNIMSWSSSNHLLVMFHDDSQCITPVYREASKVSVEVKGLVESQRGKLEEYKRFAHLELLEKLLNIVNKSFMYEYLSTNFDYILTADNFLKMLLIIMRARCNVPIVIMGETGCGKTSLIRYLTTQIMQESFETINFHAGVKEDHIKSKMSEIINKANLSKFEKIWVFLDEINTCDCMGFISELICQKSLIGVRIPDNIIFIAACNPYKLRKGGLEVGLIKQRTVTRLVYTVHPLPDSLIDYVWDYGSLSEHEEKLYIGNILTGISGEIRKLAIDLVCRSQSFVRKCEDKYSVSLRDVARFKILHEWFYKMLFEKNEKKDNKQASTNLSTFNIENSGYSNILIKFTGKLMVARKALILSLLLCYYNRLSLNQDRIDYKKLMAKVITISEKDLEEMINEEQRDIVTRMELPPAVAINRALLENVFTLLVCIINKIPLFICGKPGCSKSLSVQLLVSNLRGADSPDPFFKKLPRLLAIPYQGSESSTSEGIEKIFEKAYNVLKNETDNSILPLIVFDEIGLAEISKNNPLKILHSLLEPEKAEIAFVGISNWRLDASKMNRAVFLARPDPDLIDLENTALSIFEYYNKDPRFDEKSIMKSLAKSYYDFKIEQSEAGNSDFHGTRDFYSLIKQVTREFSRHKNNYNEVKFQIIKTALCRNFGGLSNSIDQILNNFSKNMKISNEEFSKVENKSLINLISENLLDYGDSRYLLLFTNGDSASYILDNYLKLDLKERVFMIGSEFEGDKDKDEHSFRLLSDIILYMENGNSIIMKNLDQIYGSLYDLFNQNFMIVGKKKNCRIALGSTNNPMCFVNNNFHCIVLVDIKNMYKMDPPFLNRFEKQILTFDSILTSRQKDLVLELDKWIDNLTSISSVNKNDNSKILKSDLIITYNDEFCASIVLSHFSEEKSSDEIIDICKKEVMLVSSISFLVYSVLSDMYQNSRDEIIKCHKVYFEEQYHDSLNQYMSYMIKAKPSGNKLIVYTYSNILDEFKFENDIKHSILNIAELKSEKEFIQRFKLFLNSENEFIFIKFDMIKEKNHIPMIKFKIDKFLSEYKKINENSIKNVVIIIYLSRSLNYSVLDKSQSQEALNNLKLDSHFLSDWDQIMIDCLSGGQIDNLKHLLNLTTIEIIKKSVDQKLIAEMVFNLYLKFNYTPYNRNDDSLVKLYMTDIIHNIENDLHIFDDICKKCLYFLEGKELGDWKIKICSDRKILSKSINTFSAIKILVNEIIEEPLLNIIYYLETESSLSSYFNTGNKSYIFKQIWKEIFDKIDFTSILPYNGFQSLNINPVFSLNFPFSKNDIYQLSIGINENIDKIYVLDNNCYSNQIDDELVLEYSNELKIIREIVRNSSILFKLLKNDEYNDRSLEMAYIYDLITYFLLTQLKKEFKWKFTLEIIVEKFVGFENENIEFIFIFLWKNLKLLDSLFGIFNAFTGIFDVNFIENILRNDSLYDTNLDNYREINYRRSAELKTFTNIYNELVKLLLSKLNNLNSIKNYGKIVNTVISGLFNFSLELKGQPESMNLIFITNEFLKILSAFFENDIEECAKRSLDLFPEDCSKIDLKDFSILPLILDRLDIEYKKFKTNPSLLSKYKSSFISGKLSIFENVLLGNCNTETKLIIMSNILMDEDLIKHSGMIFNRLFNSLNLCEDLKSFEISNELLGFLSKEIKNYNYNSILYIFLTDFFRKFFVNPESKNLLKYLEKNIDNFFNYVAKSKEKEDKFSQLIGFSGLKHYLELYGKYLTNNEIEKDIELNNKINAHLELEEEPLIDIIRNYVLKCMSSQLGGTSSSLVNVKYMDLGIKWVNNKLFENNDNILSIEPNIPEFEKINKEFSIFFVSLLNEDSLDNIEKFNSIITAAKSKNELKFVIIQFFIIKVYLSFSNSNFTKSFTYRYILKIFEIVGDNIKKSLGLNSYNFISKLINNFDQNPFLCLNSKLDANRVGMISLIMQFYNSVLSFPNLCSSKIFYNPDGTDFIDSLDHYKHLFLPGGFVDFHDENLLLMMKHISENYEIYGSQVGLYECSCEFLYTIGDCTRPYYLSSCPNCSSQIGGSGHVLSVGSTCLINADNRNEPNRKQFVINHLQQKLKHKSGYFGKMADEIGTQYSIRATSPIAFRFLNLFNHSMLYLLLECGVISKGSLNSLIVIKDMKIDTKEYLFRHINTDISKISDIINSRDYYMFMIQIFNSFLKISEDKYLFTSNIDREKFEVAFQTRVIDQKMESIQGEIVAYRSLFSTDKKINYLSIIDERYEDEDIISLNNYEFYRIFRMNKLGNWNDLTNEFMKKKLNKNYQFMKLLIEKFDEICSLTYLHTIVQFTNYMLSLCNYRLSRQEAKEKKIGEFIMGNKTAEKLFSEFAHVWSKIGYKATQYGCKSLPPLDKIVLDMPISFILIDDRELGYGMYMSAALQYLGLIQNEVLEAIVYLIKENNNYQMWGNTDIHKYSIQKISPHEIIMYQTKEDFVNVLTENFAKFYDIYNSNYGQGSSVEYNFDKIENELAFILLTNKKFLNYEDLHKIQYKFELLSVQNKHSNLLLDIRTKIDQKMLAGEELNIVRRTLDRLETQNIAYLHQIFSSLEIILFNLRYATHIENLSLSIYCQKIQGSDKIVHFLKESEPLNQIKLQNILYFYELVEERLFKYVTEYISPDYCRPLEQKVKDSIHIFLHETYDEKEKYPTAEQLINVIQRFIIRCLVASIEPKFPIKEYLMRNDFWDLNVRENVIDQYYFDFPDEVYIFNTISLLETIKEFILIKDDNIFNKLELKYDKSKYDNLRQEQNKRENKLN